LLLPPPAVVVTHVLPPPAMLVTHLPPPAVVEIKSCSTMVACSFVFPSTSEKYHDLISTMG
jgi:hypothetical protein